MILSVCLESLDPTASNECSLLLFFSSPLPSFFPPSLPLSLSLFPSLLPSFPPSLSIPLYSPPSPPLPSLPLTLLRTPSLYTTPATTAVGSWNLLVTRSSGKRKVRFQQSQPCSIPPQVFVWMLIGDNRSHIET